MNMVVEHGAQKIVRRADRVEIAGEMQVYIFHRHYLRIPAARRAAFYAEHGTERGFAKSRHGVFADTVKPVCKTYRSGGFPLARWRGVYGGNKHEFAVRFFIPARRVKRVYVYFCFIFAVRLHELRVYTRLARYIVNIFHRAVLRNLYIGQLFVPFL